MQNLKTQFFILTPTPTDRHVDHCTVYQDASGADMLWSAPFPIPAIGDVINVTMNGIGKATVKGYFKEWGGHGDGVYGNWYVGVITKAHNPPDWLKKQLARSAKDLTKPLWVRQGLGCEFGMEISLIQPMQHNYPIIKRVRTKRLSKGRIRYIAHLSDGREAKIRESNNEYIVVTQMVPGCMYGPGYRHYQLCGEIRFSRVKPRLSAKEQAHVITQVLVEYEQPVPVLKP